MTTVKLPQQQKARLNYLQWQNLYDHEKPFQVFAEVPENSTERLTNLVFVEAPPVVIADIRGNESRFTLDQNGFMIRRHALLEVEMSTEQHMRKNVLPSLDALVKQEIEGADFVHCFDWGFRTNNSTAEREKAERMDVNNKMHVLSPGGQVHCDQSPAGALNRLKTHCPEIVPEAARGRLRIINLWRPLHHVIKDNTLAVCDGSTILQDHLVEADHISRTYLGNTMYGLYSPDHRWYYLHHQTPEEVFFIKIFDSDPKVPAGCSLHVAFNYNNIPEDALPRESMEVRYLVVTLPRD